MVAVSIRTFGFPEIRRDDQPCPLALRKGLALLTYLAEANGPVGREMAATLLWPESSAAVVKTRSRAVVRGHAIELVHRPAFSSLACIDFSP